ncbi:sugar ABC transporter permease [Opitutaceae bacterium TAV5]|nr:sugar ABC transporter permease [Opitutaceae bacterium TAV5]
MARNQIIFPLLGLVLLCIIMICVSRQFLTPQNLSNVALQVSTNAVLAVGMTFVILTGGIDLSVGAVMALSMTVIAGSMLAGVPPPVGIGLGVLTGFAFGCFNGFVVSYGRLPSIIVTLGAMEISRGIGLLYTKGYPFSGLPESFAFWGRGSIAGIPVPVLIMLGVFAVAWIILTYFPIGRYIYGIGGNEDAVRLSGVPVRRYKFLVYAFSGLTAGIAAVVLSSRLMSGQPNAGIGFELDAIAAVVLGGTSIAGGRGHIVGTLIGALTLGVLNNGLNLMGVSPYTQKVLKGAIILLAVYASNMKKEK